jgi:excinuclease UvrABC nuclease subunit
VAEGVMIDIASLPSIPFGSPPDMPGGEGVYFVIGAEDRVIYIGSSWMLKSRWQRHNKQAQCVEAGAIRIAWFNCDWRQAEDIEAEMIFALKPRLNVRGKRTQLVPSNYLYRRTAP